VRLPSVQKPGSLHSDYDGAAVPQTTDSGPSLCSGKKPPVRAGALPIGCDERKIFEVNSARSRSRN
jgi:hypothetical protein